MAEDKSTIGYDCDSNETVCISICEKTSVELATEGEQQMSEYTKLVTKRDGRYEMLYLTDYELGLSKKRRNKDMRVYTEDEMLKMIGRLTSRDEQDEEKKSLKEVVFLTTIIIGLIIFLLVSKSV
jgi:hypothetical protein